MKIEQSTLSMSSTHAASQKHEVRETLRAWVGDKRPDFEGRERSAPVQAPPMLVHISDNGKAALSGEAQSIKSAADAADNDPGLQLIKQLIELLIGRQIEVVHASDLGGDVKPPPDIPTQQEAASKQQPAEHAGWGAEYDYHESTTETEQTSFQANGVIRTTDGKEIKFDLSFTMQRNYHDETNVSLRAGDAHKIDPIVINFAGTAAQLSDQRFAFDLNADGSKENIHFVQGGGFLALDRNGDGKINNGSELFGPTSGDGFAELKALDSDGNGWIDENDPAYQKLQVWTKDDKGADKYASLKAANVGALYLGHVDTPFDVKDGQNNLQAQVRSTGVWLSEDDKAGSVQQIDLMA